MNFFRWLRYKLWYYELAAFIREQGLKRGAEVGVKAGRSFVVFLRKNPELKMVGMDLWEDQPNSPYAHNAENERKCRERAARFGSRAELFKGDAAKIALNFPDQHFDFVFYDCFNYRISTPEFHKYIIAPWLPKIKSGGYLIGRDFHEPDVVKALNELGYGDIRVMQVKGRESLRLKHVRKP